MAELTHLTSLESNIPGQPPLPQHEFSNAAANAAILEYNGSLYPFDTRDLIDGWDPAFSDLYPHLALKQCPMRSPRQQYMQFELTKASLIWPKLNDRHYGIQPVCRPS